MLVDLNAINDDDGVLYYKYTFKHFMLEPHVCGATHAFEETKTVTKTVERTKPGPE